FLLTLDPPAQVTDSGTLTPDQPVLTYPLQVDAGTLVVVEMRAVVGEETDPVLVAYGGDGQEIAFDDDGGGFPNARMSFIAPGGPIEVDAGVFEDFYGAYTLAVFGIGGAITFG
ncbi:MAG TPA: hypothetical protein VMM13_04450, partial [Euzebya sp.]|nr:hypothetical protein [Euzebya sp.]